MPPQREEVADVVHLARDPPLPPTQPRPPKAPVVAVAVVAVPAVVVVAAATVAATTRNLPRPRHQRARHNL